MPARKMLPLCEKPMRVGAVEVGAVARILCSGEVIEFMKANPTGADANRVATTCVTLITDPQSNPHQACAYLLSAITALLPGLETSARTSLIQMGKVVRVYDDRTFKEIFFELKEAIDFEKLLVIVGQLIFLLFKNIREVSYEPYMQARIRAMKKLIGVAGHILDDENISEVVVPFERANQIMVILGAQQELKANLLRLMLGVAAETGVSSQIFAYICSMLCWNDMSSIMSILETLCLTRSPLLWKPELRYEVKNLVKGWHAINNSEMPQYYRIIRPYFETRCIENSKFPILASVAHKLKAERSVSTNRFTFNAGVIDSHVDDLCREHKAFLLAQGTPQQVNTDQDV